MLKRILSIVLSALLCATMFASGVAEEAQQVKLYYPSYLQESEGEALVLDKMPERIVCLSNAALQILVRCGIQPVAVTEPASSVEYPDWVYELPVISTSMTSLDSEAIIAMEPDLLIVGSYQKETYQNFLGETRREAEMKAMQFQIEFDRNPSKALAQYGKETMKKQKDTKPASYEDMTVGECIDAYIDNLVGVSSATTIRRYRKDRAKFFQSIMDIRLKDLTQPMIQTAVSTEAKRYAAKSVHCAHGLLSAALSIYKPDFTLRTNLPPIPEPDLQIPEEEDVRRLLQHVEGRWLEIAVLLGACAGMRRSEICALKFTDIDLDKSLIHIRRTMVKDDKGEWIVQERTKTVKSKRDVTLPPVIIEKLWNRPRNSEFVIGVVPDTVSKEFIDTRNALGLKCRFHDLRHYNASIMLALNVPDKYAMERMGYSTPATLKKVYQHTMTGKRAEVNDMINGHMAAAFLSK